MTKLKKLTYFLATRARLFDNLHLVLFASTWSFFAFVIYLHHFKDHFTLFLVYVKNTIPYIFFARVRIKFSILYGQCLPTLYILVL